MSQWASERRLRLLNQLNKVVLSNACSEIPFISSYAEVNLLVLVDWPWNVGPLEALFNYRYFMQPLWSNRYQ